MEAFVWIFTVLFSYLFGSINTSIVICKIIHRKDIRDYGSGNAGLTNVLRTFGKPTAALTLVVDLIKGIAAVLICRLVAGHFSVELLSNPLFVNYLSCLFVILGHIFPCYYGFRGGKGVLLTATTMIAVDPLTCGVAVAIFIIVVSISRYVSLASIIAVSSFPVCTIILQTLRGYEKPWQNAIIALAVAIIVVLKHKSNIVRLENGTENKLSFKSKKS